MGKNKNILLAFYGDDLTGSTDALEFICRAGAKTVLFLEPPSLDELNKYEGLQAYGIAGLTRSLSPDIMEQQLIPAFNAMKESGARHVHYKVCSTFDSSAQIGSIGKAIDCGEAVFENKFIPVLGGMPALGRYCVFGNLFARMGTTANGQMYRIDRHPSMSKHPITPLDESDLRLHIGKQTRKKIGLIDVVEIEKDIDKWNEVIQSSDEVVLLDALTEGHLFKVGEWLDAQCKNDITLFSVGPSGVEMGLGKHWNKTGVIEPMQTWQEPGKADPLLVLSGSCSPVTKNQIAFALAHGFAEVPLEVEGYHRDNEDDFVFRFDLLKLNSCLENKQSVIIHTGNIQNVEQSKLSEKLGSALGSIAFNIIDSLKLKRVVVAGGDTSSYVGRVLGIKALEMISPLVPGAPLCKVLSAEKSIDGLEVSFKGGQVGNENYFVLMREGSK